MRIFTYKALIVFAIALAATILTVYIRRYHAIDIVYTHFFYIPVIFATYWFGIKGILAGIYLSGLVFLGPIFGDKGSFTLADSARALIMILVSVLTAKMAETIKKQNEKLKVSEEFYKSLFENTGSAILVSDQDTTILLANQQFEKLSGLSRSQIEGKMSWREFFLETDLENLLMHYYSKIPSGGNDSIIEAKFVSGEDVIRDVLVSLKHVNSTNKTVINIQDITPLKQLRTEKDFLSKRLEEALAKVLSGFIPICASCKKIRIDSGDWVSVENYITDRSNAQFSHSICPECMERLYGSYLSKDQRESFRTEK